MPHSKCLSYLSNNPCYKSTLFSCKGCDDNLLRFQQMTSPQWQNLEQREAYQRLIETVSVLHRLATRLSSRAEIVGAVRQVQLNKHMQMTVQMEKVQNTLLQDVFWYYFKMTMKIVVWFPSATDNIIINRTKSQSRTKFKAPVKWLSWASSNIKKSLEWLSGWTLDIYVFISWNEMFGCVSSVSIAHHKEPLFKFSAAGRHWLCVVQQEKRMNKATEVMMQYVENLKRTYEKDHAELMEFKKLANQNSNRCYGGSIDTGGKLEPYISNHVVH